MVEPNNRTKTKQDNTDLSDKQAQHEQKREQESFLQDDEANLHTLEEDQHQEKEPGDDIYDSENVKEQVDTGEIESDEGALVEGYEEHAKEQFEDKETDFI